MMRGGEARITHIDGLRAVAVLCVLFFHAGLNDSAAAHSHPALAFLLRQGSHGVDLFFVLSGFCLAYPALARRFSGKRPDFNVAGFAARRLVRIVPPYYAAIALLLGVCAALIRFHVASPEALNLGAYSPSAIVKQLLFLDHDRVYLNSSFWTLAIEFRWYFLFPIVLWVWTRSRFVFALIGVAAACAGQTGASNVDLLFLPSFMLGIVAADIYIQGYQMAWCSWILLPVLLAGAIGAGSGLTTGANHWAYIQNPLWGPALFCLVVAAGTSHVTRAALSWKPLTFVGFTSYGIYLIHEPVIGFVEQYGKSFVSGPWLYSIMCAGGLIAGIAFSLLAEKPFVSSRLRDLLVADSQRVLLRLFALGRVQPSFSLGAYVERPRIEHSVLTDKVSA